METPPAGDDGDRDRDPDAAGSVEIRVNGETRSIREGLTVAGLLEVLGVDGRRVAVERNHEIVPRAERGETELEPGDVLEIVQFVGGGGRPRPARDERPNPPPRRTLRHDGDD